MNELSEQELLLLSNYAYFDCSTNKGTIQENINSLKNDDGTFDMDKVVSQGATGDIISNEDAVDILERLESDDKLNGLHAARVINRGGIRATLYADDGYDDATLVFRGTGGTYKAWQDNVLGEYEADTRLQTLAKDFVKYECGAYEHITVTGHSKGGNLSQYVTVVCADQIDKCVSFDGQGFGDNFLETHKEEVDVAKGKITCINAYNDFVNILLTPIAGTILYVNNQEGLGVDMHSCYTMLSNGAFDENGDFDRSLGVKPQQNMIKAAKYAGDSIVSLMEILPGDGNKKAADVLGAFTAAIFSSDKGDEYEKDKIASTIKEFRNYAGELIGIATVSDESVSYGCDYLYFNVDSMKAVHSELTDITYRIGAYPDMIEDLLLRLDYSILGRSLTEKALRKIIMRANDQYEKLKIINDTLLRIIECYEKADEL